MKKTTFFAFFMLFFTISLYSQSADSVTNILESQQVNYAQVSYFVAVHLELLPDGANEQQAMNVLTLANISDIPENPYKPLTYKKFSQMCMNAWIKKGGLMYSITKSPRYAFREMQSLGLISLQKYPNQYLSGKEALNIMSKCIKIYESRGNK